MIHFPAVLFVLASGSSPDSIPLAQAKEWLSQGDTLTAMEILHDWSASHPPTRELTDLLGALHLPDEPPEPPDTAAPVRKAPERKWWIRGDGGSLLSDRLSWDVAATIATRLREFPIGDRKSRIEAGLAAMAWSASGSDPALGVEGFSGWTAPVGRWDLRLDAWTGILGEEWDAGLSGILSKSSIDSSVLFNRWGLLARYSYVATSLLGGFCQLEKERGTWIWEARWDLRLRRDPVLDDKDAPDTLRFTIQGARAQFLTRSLLLRRWGLVALGPALELDARSSLAYDQWRVGSRKEERLRRDGSVSAGLVGRLAAAKGNWGEARIGWTKAVADSDIDPGFADRNSGLVSSVSVLSSF